MRELIYLIDDDQNITTSVSMALSAEGYAVECFHDGVDGLAGIKAKQPDLAVLDVKMPRMDGLELLAEIRKSWESLPVIMLTSKDDEIDQVLGLRLGADDYMTKPFSQRILIERIHALLRRQKSIAHHIDNFAAEKQIIRGLLTLDDDRFLCQWDGNNVPLTVTEYLLVKTLAQDCGVVCNREILIEAAYDHANAPDEKTVDTHIKRIRKKFKAVDPDFNHIEAVYGAGYKFSV